MTIVARRHSIPFGSEAYQTHSSVASAKRTSTLWTMKKHAWIRKVFETETTTSACLYVSIWKPSSLLLSLLLLLVIIIIIINISFTIVFIFNSNPKLLKYKIIYIRKYTYTYIYIHTYIYIYIHTYILYCYFCLTRGSSWKKIPGSHDPWMAPRCQTRTEPRGLQRFATGAGATRVSRNGPKTALVFRGTFFPQKIPKRWPVSTHQKTRFRSFQEAFHILTYDIVFIQYEQSNHTGHLRVVYSVCCRFRPSHATPTCPSGDCLVSGASEWRAICRWIAEYARSACYSYRHLCPGRWRFSDSIEVLEY